MNFTNATILSYSNDYLYFGENGFNYKTKQNISIEGVFVGNSAGLINFVNSFQTANTFESIIINGVNFGTGKILEASFSDGDSPNAKSFTASLEVYKDGNLLNFPVVIPSPEMIESLSENFSLTEGQDNNKSFSHSINISYLDSETNDPLNLAKTLANSLIASSDIAFFINNGFDSTDYRKYSSESVDTIGKEYSVTQTFSFMEDGETYDYDITLSSIIGEDGITTITENGFINGIVGANKEDLFQNAVSGSQTVISDSFSRADLVFQNFKQDSDFELNQIAVSKNRTFNKLTSSVEYEISYSNDPSVQNLYDWDYDYTISKDRGIYTVTENGNILGHGKAFPIDSSSAIKRAEDAFSTIQGGINQRIDSFYKANTNDFRSLSEISSNITYSEIEGKITYSYEYSSKPKDSLGGNIKSEVAVRESFPVSFQNKFTIFRFKEIAQELDLATVGVTSINLKMMGDKDTKTQDYYNYVNAIITKYAPAQGVKQLIYLESPKIKYEPINNMMEFSANWKWHVNFDELNDL